MKGEQLEETFRNWLYRVLTEFGEDVALRLGNRIHGVENWCDQQDQRVNRARLDTNNYLAGLIIGAPWPIDQIISWFMALICNYIVNPAFDTIRGVFIWASDFIVSLYDFSNGGFIPQLWLRTIICTVRDRLVNLIDDTASIFTSTWTWVTDKVNSVLTHFQPLIDTLNTWRTDVSTWIGQNLYNPLMAVIADITDLGAEVFRLGQTVDAITSDPVAWIWSHMEPYLRTKVEAWLNSIWYTRI